MPNPKPGKCARCGCYLSPLFEEENQPEATVETIEFAHRYAQAVNTRYDLPASHYKNYINTNR